MMHYCFSVFDSRTLAYLPPFFLQSAPQAERAIGDCVNDPKHEFGKHPEDYTLFALGTFDDLKGSFELLATPAPVAKCIELKTPEPS